MALTRIQLQDFVIVHRLELELNPGFSVLTGETGAGKSILIDALQLVLGARADTGVIRELSSGATTSEGWTAFVTKVWKSCGKYGANYGVNETARDEALKDMVQFFSDALKPKS